MDRLVIINGDCDIEEICEDIHAYDLTKFNDVKAIIECINCGLIAIKEDEPEIATLVDNEFKDVDEIFINGELFKKVGND